MLVSGNSINTVNKDKYLYSQFIIQRGIIFQRYIVMKKDMAELYLLIFYTHILLYKDILLNRMIHTIETISSIFDK